MRKAGMPNRLVAVAAAVAAAIALTAAAAPASYHGGEAENGPNPCLDPVQAQELLCPDLRMAPPSHMYISRSGGGRRLLHAENNIQSRGAGPIEVRGKRSGRRVMDVNQRIHRAGGGRLSIATLGHLAFYFIPDQGRFWKFRDAARFELWTVDERNALARRVRSGPKLDYCLRDLERTKPGPASPAGRVYPACSQDPSRRSVVLGTSVGWSDIYPADYYENWISVNGLRGCFAFVHQADPKNHLRESNEDNNYGRVLIRLPSGRRVGSC